MRNFEDWLNGVPLAGTVGAAFLAGTIYGREFDINWETLAAGFLGLVGGGFALLSAKKQINHQIQVAADKKRIFARRFLQETKAQVDILNSTISKLIEDEFEVTKPQVEFYIGVINANTLHEIPAEIDDGLAQKAITLKQFLNMFTMDFSIYLTGGFFNQRTKKLFVHHQKMIRTIDHQLRELNKAIASNLNS